MTDFKDLIAKAATGVSLDQSEAESAFNTMMSGDATPAQIGAFLMSLRVRGETIDEITGAAKVMRAKATKINAPAGAIDCCGTGGDGKGSLNVSTAVSFVIAGAGAKVAKHGNRAASSKTGAADVLQALGLNIDADMKKIEQSIAEAGVGFLMAQRHHGAMKHVGPIRAELGTRTIFNILGPLSNPAGTKHQLIGVFSQQFIAPMASVLGNLGSERAWVVHGSDGMDELTTTGISYVAETRAGEAELSMFEIDPQALGLAKATEADLAGGDSEFNAEAIRRLLSGETGAYRDIVLLNSAASLVVAGIANDLTTGIEAAAASLDGGKAKAALNQMVAISNG